MGDVLLAGEEAQEGAALEGGVVANGTAECRVAGFEGTENCAERGGLRNFQRGLVRGELRKGAEVGGEFDTDGCGAHARVWTSMERTAGRSRTMGAQESPESGEA